MKKLILFLLIFLNCSLVIANENEETSVIENITIEKILFIDDQGKEITHPTLNFVTTLKVGEELDTEKLIVDINELSTKFPTYSEITAKIDPGKTDEFVIITFLFQKKRKIKYVNIQLNNVEEYIGIKDQLSSQKGLLLKGSSVDRDKETLKEIYQKEGYAFVEVEERINTLNDKGDVALEFIITATEGKITLNDIKFIGNQSIKGSKLKKLILSRESGFFSKYQLNLIQVETDLKEITKFYRENGFLDVKVSHKVTQEKKGQRNLEFTIEEGKQQKIEKLAFNGNKVIEQDDIEDIFDYELPSGYNEKSIRIGLQKIRESYGKMGYPLVNAITDYNPKEKKLSIFISEGEKQVISEIVVTGNEHMKEDIILRDVSFVPGEIVNTEEIQDSLNKMRKTGYYDDVRIDYSPNGDGLGVVYVTVEEARAHFIEFGIGYSSSGLGGDIGYRNPNLFDAGRSISINASKDEELLKLGLIYKDPHLFGTDLELETSANYGSGEQEHYHRSRASMRIVIKKLITDNLKIGLGTRVEFMDISDVSSELASEVHDATGRSRVIGMMSTIVYKDEKYDNQGNTIDGHRMKLALLPSYSDQGAYLKAVSEVMASRSIGTNVRGNHHIISSRITLGYASENTPFYEKFYAGGTNSIRGYKSRSISPDNSVVGGSMMASANLSYSFPLWKEALRGVVFLEAASVGNEISELSNVRVVAGAGVRANLRDTFLRNNIEAGFATPLSSNEDDAILRPFYFMLGNYDPAYDL
jgi:outer membrane protein insertion porin family